MRIKRLIVTHFKGDAAFFAWRRLAAAEVVGYYYGSLPYAHLSSRLDDDKECCDGTMPKSHQSFRTSVMCLKNKVKKRIIGAKVSIKPTKCKSMRFIDSARRLPSEEELQGSNKRPPNVACMEGAHLIRLSKFTAYRTVPVKTMRAEVPRK